MGSAVNNEGERRIIKYWPAGCALRRLWSSQCHCILILSLCVAGQGQYPALPSPQGKRRLIKDFLGKTECPT